MCLFKTEWLWDQAGQKLPSTNEPNYISNKYYYYNYIKWKNKKMFKMFCKVMDIFEASAEM